MIVNDYDLHPGEYALIPGKGPRLHLLVFSLKPVNAFLVDQQNLERYRRREPFRHFGPGVVTSFSGFLEIPAGGDCFAIIENADRESVQVSAKLWS